MTQPEEGARVKAPAAMTPVLLPQKCVQKGPKMLHWLPALSVLVATRPGLRVALGTATILLVFTMAVVSLVRIKGIGSIYRHPGYWACWGLKGNPWI